MDIAGFWVWILAAKGVIFKPKKLCQGIHALMRLFLRVGGKLMKKLYVYSPPFCSFLIETFITGRNIKFEKNHMDGALSQCADSG